MSGYFQEDEVKAFTELASENFSLFTGKMYDFADEITDRGHEVAANCLRWMYIADRWPEHVYAPDVYATEWICQFVDLDLFIDSYCSTHYGNKQWFPNVLVKNTLTYKTLYRSCKEYQNNSNSNSVISIDDFKYFGYIYTLKGTKKFIFQARHMTLIEAIEYLMSLWTDIKEKDRIMLMKLAEVSKMAKNI